MKDNEENTGKNKDNAGTNNETENAKRLKYPKQVLIILVMEFCERFCFYGMKSVLVLYLAKEVQYSYGTSINIYHTYVAFCYFTPIIGAVVSDGSLGKFKTILIFSVIYFLGNLILSLSAITPLKMPQGVFACVSLFLVALGTGGIKPCVSSFGGDQFVIPEQQKHFEKFFYLFYMAINLGSTAGTIVVPPINEEECFGEESCYPAGFGISSALMVVAIVFYLLGAPLYKYVLPKVNIILLWLLCVGNAIKERCKSKEKVAHWLDRSEPKYGKLLVRDVKGTFRVMLVFLPLMFFWTLFDQTGSTWMVQANQMDSVVGSVTILPGNMVSANSVFIVILIPFFTYGVYPLCDRLNIPNRPLQRIAAGGFITSLSFFSAALVNGLGIEPDLPVLPADEECQIRIYNPLDCAVVVDARPYLKNKKIGPMGYEKVDVKGVKKAKKVGYKITGCGIANGTGSDFKVDKKATLGYFVTRGGLKRFEDDISKDLKGRPKVRTLVSSPDENLNLTYWKENKENSVTFKSNNYSFNLLKADLEKAYTLKVKIDKSKATDFAKEFKFYRGGYYVVLVYIAENKIKDAKVYTITLENKFPILWQIPQYFLLTMGEVLVSPTALEFAYTQAPPAMKSAMTSLWLVTTGLGNLLVLATESLLSNYVKLSIEFTIYGVLMIVFMLVFVLIATKYEYIDHTSHEDYTYDQ